MIKNPACFGEWEKEHRRKLKPDFFHNLKIYEAVYKEAQFLRQTPPHLGDRVYRDGKPLAALETRQPLFENGTEKSGEKFPPYCLGSLSEGRSKDRAISLLEDTTMVDKVQIGGLDFSPQ